MSRETRNHLIWICLLWVVFSAVGEGLVQAAIERWPLIASEQGEITGEAIFFLLRATVPVFVLVTLILTYAAVRFRVPEDDSEPAAAQYAGGRAFVAGWVGLSIVLNVFFILHPGISGLEDLWSKAQAATASDPLDIEVTGRQWQWDYSYGQYDIKTTNVLVVPKDRPIRFTLNSADVMHSFWVPAWGIKKAVIPGETRTLFITPNREASVDDDPTVRTQCAQICGVGHARMRSAVRVVSNDAFAEWIDSRKEAGHDEGGHGMNMPGMDMPSGPDGHDSMSGMDGSGMNGSGMTMSDDDMKNDADSDEDIPAMTGNMPQKSQTAGPDADGAMPGMKMPEGAMSEGSMQGGAMTDLSGGTNSGMPMKMNDDRKQ